MDAFDLLFAAYESMRGEHSNGGVETFGRGQKPSYRPTDRPGNTYLQAISEEDFDKELDSRQAESDQYAKDLAGLQSAQDSRLPQEAQARVQLSRQVFYNKLPEPLEPRAVEFPDAGLLESYKYRFQ